MEYKVTTTERDETQKWECKTNSFVILGQKKGEWGETTTQTSLMKFQKAKTLEQLAGYMQDTHMQELQESQCYRTKMHKSYSHFPLRKSGHMGTNVTLT